MTHPNDELKACRSAFEKWASGNFLDLTQNDPMPPMINERHYADNSVMQMWLAYQDAWNSRAEDEAKGGEAVGDNGEVTCEVVGHVKDGEDGPFIEWTVEGGIHDLPPGLPIFALEGNFDTQDGWASLYTSPRPTADELKKLIMCANRGKWLLQSSVYTYDQNEGERPQLVCANIHTEEVVDKYIQHDISLGWFVPFK